MQGRNLARLRKTLLRYARNGWVRAVFSRPQRDGGPDAAEPESVHEGPGVNVVPDEAQLQALVRAAETAAKQGQVRQTLLVDEQTRVRIDARYGRAKVQQLDDATLTKMMGGKQRALRPDHSAALLRAIGIMNADGTISAKHAKKYKQVNHLVELFRPTWERLGKTRAISREAPLRIADLACGNSYLTLVVAESLRLENIAVRLHGIDIRADVIERSRARAEDLGLTNLTFAQCTIAQADVAGVLDGPPDLVMALHACDTATDEALALAIKAKAPAIFVAPCCQREIAAQLKEHGQALPVRAMAQHGLLRQDYAATLTDAIRVDVLTACGYHVDTMEFVASEHTPKNLLIRAHYGGTSRQPERIAQRLGKLTERCSELGVAPSLLALLSEDRLGTTDP